MKRPSPIRLIAKVNLFVCAFLVFSQLAVAQMPAPPDPNSEKVIEEFSSWVLPDWVRGNFHKWAAAPKISCFGDTAKYKPIVQQFAAEMNIVLDGLAAKPVVIDDNTWTADILFMVDTPEKLRQARLREKAGPAWRSRAFWNDDHTLQRYCIFEDPENLKKTNYYRSDTQTVYRLLLQTMGIFPTKDMPPALRGISSVFGQSPSPVNPLSDLDKKVIRFSYEFLKSGAMRPDIAQTLRKNWSLVKVPEGVVAPAAPVGPNPVPAAPLTAEQKLEKWVVDVMTNRGQYTFRKWQTPPRVSCLWTAAECRAFVAAFFGEVDEALKGLPVQPALVQDNDKNAEITVIIYKTERAGENAATAEAKQKNGLPSAMNVALKNTPGFVANRVMPYLDQSANPFATYENRLQRWQMQVKQAARIENGAFVFPPAGQGSTVRDTIVLSGMESLGLWAVEGEMDSVLCPHTREHLTALDRKLMRFAYQYVPTGSSKETISKLFREHWGSLP